jgi:hypothetical protein
MENTKERGETCFKVIQEALEEYQCSIVPAFIGKLENGQLAQIVPSFIPPGVEITWQLAVNAPVEEDDTVIGEIGPAE